jgi:three-Cys-motif partner protein
MSKKEYDWNLGEPPPRIKPHSIAKQKVYTEYIKEYIHTLNSNPLIPNFNIVIVDAFAGGGEYLTQDNQRHNGSPIKIIETVKATEKTINETRKKQFTIKQQYFFLEKKKANLDYLKS